MPPLLAHGSVPKVVNNFPFVKAFPNWFYGDCIYNWKIKGEEGPSKLFGNAKAAWENHKHGKT